MKAIVLYTNERAVKSDLAALQQAKKQLEQINTFLISKGITLDETNIKNATNKVFTIPVELFKQTETEKVQKLIDIVGTDSVLTDGWEKKVNEKVETFKQELINQCPVFNQTDYLQYFNFEKGIEIDSTFEEQYFIDKNSTILSTPEEIEFYKKHCKAVELLNYLIQHPDNEFIALDKLFFFNSETKEFELNLKQYRDLFAEQAAEEQNKRAFIIQQNYEREYQQTVAKIKAEQNGILLD